MVKCIRCGKGLGKVHHLQIYCTKCSEEYAKNYQEEWRKENKEWTRNWNKALHKKNMEKQDFLKSLPPDELLKHVRGLK